MRRRLGLAVAREHALLVAVDSGDLAAAEQKLEAELLGWQQKFARPLIMTEYGADTVAGYHSIYYTPFTEE